MKSPFTPDPRLTGIAIAYRNRTLIADSVLPRVPVGSDPFKYHVYNKADRFTVPNTRVGRKGQPQLVEFGATEVQASTEDYGLRDVVPQHDVEHAPEGYDPIGNATEGIMDLVMLDRELRASALVFALATYPAAQRETLAGTDQWSDPDDSTPVDDIATALDAPLMRPNVMVLGQQVATKLRSHPQIVKAFNGTSGDAGIVPTSYLATLFELEEIVVGSAFVNTAKPGQAPTYARAWGKHCALIHRNRQANVQRGVTFGLTAEFGTRIARSDFDKNIGLKGGWDVRAGESVKELVVASDAGYFFENAVA